MRLLVCIFILLLSAPATSATHNYFFCSSKGVFDDECGCQINKKPDGQMDFLINKTQLSVMARYYENGKIIGSELFKNCKIFDTNNWDCSYEKSDEISLNTQTTKMFNGVFLYKSRFIFNNGHNNTLTHTCAKKSGWFN